MSRRAFVTGSTATLAGLLAGCGDGVLGGDPGGITNAGGFQISVGQFPTLAAIGGVAFVTGASVPLIVVRTGDQTFDVFNRRCPHNGTQINLVASGFRCPNHGAQFTRAGTWTGGQRTTDLRRIAASFDPATGLLTLG